MEFIHRTCTGVRRRPSHYQTNHLWVCSGSTMNDCRTLGSNRDVMHLHKSDSVHSCWWQSIPESRRMPLFLFMTPLVDLASLESVNPSSCWGSSTLMEWPQSDHFAFKMFVLLKPWTDYGCWEPCSEWLPKLAILTSLTCFLIRTGLEYGWKESFRCFAFLDSLSWSTMRILYMYVIQMIKLPMSECQFQTMHFCMLVGSCMNAWTWTFQVGRCLGAEAEMNVHQVFVLFPLRTS